DRLGRELLRDDVFRWDRPPHGVPPRPVPGDWAVRDLDERRPGPRDRPSAASASGSTAAAPAATTAAGTAAPAPAARRRLRPDRRRGDGEPVARGRLPEQRGSVPELPAGQVHSLEDVPEPVPAELPLQPGMRSERSWRG